MKTVLHPAVALQLEAALARPFGSYIMVGPRGVGRTAIAYELARELNCHHTATEPCASCQQLASGNHPQLITLDSGDKASIGIERVRALKSELALARYDGRGTRVVVVPQADTLTNEAQNAMLKLMEEPPEATMIILIVSTLERLLPTVRSRSQLITISSPEQPDIMAWLGRTGVTPQLAERALRQAPGLPLRALTLARDTKLLEVVEQVAEMSLALTEQSTFDRLITIMNLGDDKSLPRQIARGIEQQLKTLLRQGSDVSRQVVRLAAVERCYLRLDANVTPRLALEALVLEL